MLLTALFAKNLTAQSDGAAVLNIVLHPVQTLTINTADQTVNLEYRTREDYSKGVSLNKENHLQIYSTGGYVIRVKTADPRLQSAANSAAGIDAGDITVTASKGTTTGYESFISAPVQLSASFGELISSPAGASKAFNINYTAKGDNKYLNLFTKNQNPTVYTTQVVYSIEPQ
ncbi:hypothetical protein NBC122_01305 [Chryseobacterium salivictor]|uniref:Uncharacterized protein n=2 Tax=Chryseobacterium salivictor TaxID=2547600 RepID=A0A4P6ZFA1_9FLAO|nr:hypothetical protein NBC122_01305 [Chryseobacterium salivictor]